MIAAALAALGCRVDPSSPLVGEVPLPGTDTDTGPIETDRVLDDDHLLVVPDGVGLTLVGADHAIALASTWTELVGACDACNGEGASDDGDGLLVSFTTSYQTGAIARVDPWSHAGFRVDGFLFPHDVVRDPIDGAIAVGEAFNHQIRWIAGDGSSDAPIRAIGAANPGWEDDDVNGLERIDVDGRTFLLESMRGGNSPNGAIKLWDIGDPDALRLVWRFPETGFLYAPHSPILRRRDDGWWLLYAHSAGTTSTSTVGVARTDDPEVRPAYVADLIPEDPDPPFAFLRGVELGDDGTLFLTDSGGGLGNPCLLYT
ncbi:MAG: hypothetical protein ABMB14_19005, partial [Myxococcota bacterium]